MHKSTFTKYDFEIFDIPDLDGRMNAIKEILQPKFKEIGQTLIEELQPSTSRNLYLHIAKHARRTVNPPKDTWLAISSNKRGYKKHPHFEVGLFDDRIFIWLSFIYELPNKKLLGNSFLSNIEFIEKTIPKHYVISQNHMQKGTHAVKDSDLVELITQFRDIKKSELLIGQQIMKDDPLIGCPEDLHTHILEIFTTLLPIYQFALETIEIGE